MQESLCFSCCNSPLIDMAIGLNDSKGGSPLSMALRKSLLSVIMCLANSP